MLGQFHLGGLAVGEDRGDQIAASGETAVQRGIADAGATGDLIEGRLQSVFAEDLAGGGEQGDAVALRVSAQSYGSHLHSVPTLTGAYPRFSGSVTDDDNIVRRPQMQRSSVDIQTRDGAADGYLVRPQGNGPFPGVLLFMDAFGIRPRLQEMADRI